MSRFRHALWQRDGHILTLRIIAGGLFIIVLVLSLGWLSAPSRLTVHIPPDLRAGSLRPWWEVPPPNVYSFAYYIFQQLNAWPKNGEVDYPAKIHALSPYLTAHCQALLTEEARQRTQTGELTDRVRVVYEIPGRGFKPESVTVQSQDRWVARLDLVADEYYHTEPVKRVLVRYPIRVLRADGDAERNPFGLQLDCYDGVPQRLEAAPVPVVENKGVFQ